MEQQSNIDLDLVLASCLRSKLLHNSPMSNESCIFRVPRSLREHNEHLFEPNFISIGPYHRNLDKFQFAEKIKLWYLGCLITQAPTPETTLECFIKHIRANLKNCFACYEEEVTMNDDEFLEIMIIDGCFVIELFRRFSKIIPTSIDDPLFIMPWLRKVLVLELLLLENQLPWFVLNCLFNLTNNGNDPVLPQLVQDFFHWDALRTKRIPVDSSLQYKHLLDVQREFILFGSQDVPNEGFLPIPCVTELLRAGMDFAVGDEQNIMTITYKNGKLTIPPVMILDNAESLFRNLIAYEQCDQSLRDRITAYAGFLDNLINSSEDVEYLRQKGIITCYLSAEDVSGFFNRLYNNAHVQYSPYRQISEEINAYYQSLWPRWRAILSRDYFSSPWSIIALFGATAVLVLTFLQTLYAMK